MITFEDICKRTNYTADEMREYFKGAKGKNREFKVKLLCAAAVPEAEKRLEALKAIELFVELLDKD